MYNRLSQWDELLAPEAVDRIYETASAAATTSLASNPRLAHLLDKNPPTAEHLEHVPSELFLEAATVLESDHLTKRQQEIARLIVGTVVVFGARFTASSMARTLGTRPDTVRKTVSILAGKDDQYAPRELRYQYSVPLLKEVKGTAGRQHLAAANALLWLADDPERSQYIAEAIADIEALKDTITIDSL